MPVTTLQHRASVGAFQHKCQKNATYAHRQDFRGPGIPNEIRLTENGIRQIVNSHEYLNRPECHNATSRQGMAVPLIMLLSQIRLADTPLVTVHPTPVSANTATSPIDEHALLPASGDFFSRQILSPVATALYDSGQFIFHHDPLRFPGADASTLPPGAAVKKEMYEIQDQAINQYLLEALMGRKSINTSDSQTVMLFYPLSQEPGRGKRAAKNEQQQLQDIAYQQYLANNCHIRTKTNQGTTVGNTLLVSGEAVRNSIRAAAEQAYLKGTGGHQMPEWMVTFSESMNLAYDVVIGTATLGVYPIVKYASAKALRISGHAVNGDNICLKNEFSPEELANLLFDTEVGMTDRRAFHSFSVHAKPGELKNVRAFAPDGVFVHEGTANKLNTVQYMAVTHQGIEYYIKEKAPGEYWTFHPQAAKPALVEKRVYFDSVNNKIHLNSEMSEGQGLDFNIIEGKKFIQLYGENYEITWNWDKKQPEIVLHKENGETRHVPVYREPLSKTWHLSTHNEQRVFSDTQESIIEKIKILQDDDYNYFPEENNNTKYYGAGKTYRAEKGGDASHYIQGRYLEMNGHLVPVRQKTTPGNGVHYEVYNINKPNEKSWRVEWDGSRWIFERSTSRHVSQALEKHVTPDMFDKNVDATELSAPDSYGLRRDGKDNEYLKIKGGLVKIKKINLNRYSLLSALPNKRKTVLRFINDKFRPETIKERLKNIQNTGLGGRRRPTALSVLKEVAGFDVKSARKLLAKYNFPEDGFCNDYAFASEIEQSGSIPAWGDKFLKSRLLNKSAQKAKKSVLLMKPGFPQLKFKFKLGELLGSGVFGKVYIDEDDPLYVIKKYIDDEFYASKEEIEAEVEMFNRYYGNGAATMLVDKHDVYYVRMLSVPGKTLDSLPKNSLPADAEERFVDMIEKLNKLGIIHNDIHAGNVLWDSESQTFFPIDINNAREKFFKAKVDEKIELNDVAENAWDEVMKIIREKKIKDQPIRTIA